ncbi:phospholipid carrier-dependent glycosyltransferase [soil metagenome]
MSWSALDWVALGAVTIVAALLRTLRLADPRSLVFDETYYAKDACWYALGSRSACGIDAEQTAVHPPLGKWLIAAGVKAFGYDSFGWRIAAVVAGTMTVALLYLLARKVLRSTLGATVASGLLAFDLLHFVQSRIAMLDVFMVLFGVAAILFCVLDRQTMLEGRRGEPGRLGVSPWRLAAGVAAGAAVASKWSGGLFAITALALTSAWAWGARRRLEGRSRGPSGRREAASILLSLVVLPLLVYVLTYVGRLDGDLVALPGSSGSWLRALWDRQLYMFDFHSGLEATHPYASPAWSWILLKRPVSYFFEATPGGDYMEIFATGSPLVWWPSIPALAYVGWRWLRTRDMAGPEGLILTGFALNYFPWLVLATERSAVFLFYLLPAVPFMCLALAYVPARLARSPATAPAVVVAAAVTIALFAFYYPLLAKVAIPRQSWEQRIWVFDNCDEPPPTESAGNKVGTGDQEASEDRPPSGWCWI